MPASPAPDLTLYYPFEEKQFADHCFLCGTPTTPAQAVLVFDEWLLQRYQLAGQRIQLLDQSVQEYQNLRVPCCPGCRTRYVQPLEATVAAATAAGPAGLRALDEKTLFLWLGKMFYGILVLELLNELNPLIKPQYPLSENGQMLRRLQAFFQTFQALRVPIVFEDFVPASIFLLETDPGQDPISFEYDDDLTTMTFSIKLNGMIIIACFIDNGLLRQAMRRVYQDAQRPLHPVQLAEFKARVYYGAHLLNVIPDYYPRPIQPHDDHIIYDTLIDDITREIFNPWENSGYGQSLQEMWKRWQIPYTEIMRDPARPLSYLYDAQGTPRTLESFPVASKAGEPSDQ
ncbi:hypothetical protein SAMN02745146_3120 [Hymenobacter daecheongensis DSM 21074]|uniref:Uncharacterized protein n=1 Tax=Hymenobacter daecheongensis DSM 21074 TaxID=1121955 RepID=A0A1M6J6W0_9BACT|nr:hypothetical protein [Hymenobacter daecheongensis]SHJ42399.1 hypothetical protein SAMN02745146_3120 [Hymenobacter daecheongensis DSM 21074]